MPIESAVFFMNVPAENTKVHTPDLHVIVKVDIVEHQTLGRHVNVSFVDLTTYMATNIKSWCDLLIYAKAQADERIKNKTLQFVKGWS